MQEDAKLVLRLDLLKVDLRRCTLDSRRGKLVLVEVVFRRKLEGRAEDEGDAVEGKAEGTKEGGDDEPAVLCSLVGVGNRLALNVERSVEVCAKATSAANPGHARRERTVEEDLDLSACIQEVGDLDERYERSQSS